LKILTAGKLDVNQRRKDRGQLNLFNG